MLRLSSKNPPRCIVKGKDRILMKDTGRMLKKLLGMVEKTNEQELDCAEVFEVLDIYAEAVVRGEDTSAMLPKVKHHIEMCRDCFEEYEALVRILESPDL